MKTLDLKTLNAAIVRAMNALRNKRVKANETARNALRMALSALNEARVLLNAGDARGAYWTASSADEFILTARRAMAGAQ